MDSSTTGSSGSDYKPQGQGAHPTLAGNMLDPNVKADGAMKHGQGVGGTSEHHVREEGAEHLRRANDDNTSSTATTGSGSGSGLTSGLGSDNTTSSSSTGLGSYDNTSTTSGLGGNTTGTTEGTEQGSGGIMSTVKGYLGLGGGSTNSTATTGTGSDYAGGADDFAPDASATGATGGHIGRGMEATRELETGGFDGRDTNTSSTGGLTGRDTNTSSTGGLTGRDTGRDTDYSSASGGLTGRDTDTSTTGGLTGRDTGRNTDNGRTGEYAAGGAAAAGAGAAGAAASATGSHRAERKAEEQDLKAQQSATGGDVENRDTTGTLADRTRGDREGAAVSEKKSHDDDKIAAKRENQSSIPTAGGERLGAQHWGESKIVPDNPKSTTESAGVSSRDGQPTDEVRDNTSKNTGGASSHDRSQGAGEHGKESMVDKLKDKVHMGHK